MGLLIWVLEDGARRPPSYFDLTRLSQEGFVLLASLFTLHITTPPPYYGLQDYSLPSPTGRGEDAEWRRGGGAVYLGTGGCCATLILGKIY